MKSQQLKRDYAPHGTRVEVSRELVQQCVEPILLATGKMTDKQEINFSLLGDTVVFYVDTIGEHKDERLVCTIL